MAVFRGATAPSILVMADTTGKRFAWLRVPRCGVGGSEMARLGRAVARMAMGDWQPWRNHVSIVPGGLSASRLDGNGRGQHVHETSRKARSLG